jgi:glycosyltransferase involved in cell wall biosynthesis
MLIPRLDRGGAEMVLSYLLRGMDHSRYALRVIVLKNATVEVPIPDDVPIERIQARRFSTALPGLTWILRRRPPDVLIAHMSLPGAWAVIARKLSRRRFALAIVEHNPPTVQYANDTFRRRLVPFFIRRTYRHADALVSIANSSSADLERLLGVEPGVVQTIPNPVIDEDFETRLMEPPDHPWLADPSGRLLVGIGRLVPQKDFALLIRAFARVAPEFPDLRLVIYGEGHLRPELEALAAELAVANRVSLPGLTKNPYPALRRCSALALSSVYEGGPLVAVEAVACGARIVATSVGFLAEFLDPGAGDVVVPERTPEAFADGIRRVLTKEPQEPGRADRIAPYRIHEAARTYEQLIDRLVAGRRTQEG